MRNLFTKFTRSSLVISVIFLNAACSALDESGTGKGLSDTVNTTLDLDPANIATISPNNYRALAITGTEGIKQAIKSRESSFFLGSRTDNNNPVQLPALATTQQIAPVPAQAEIPNVCDNNSTGGTIDLNVQSKVLIITNCISNGLTLNGTASITTSETNELLITTYTFSNFTIANAVDSINIELIAICENNKNNQTLTCSYKSESTGSDNRVYRAAISNISGNDTTGYFITATVNDPDNGNINVTTDLAITLNCPDGQPDAGAITVSDGSNSLNVIFNDCTGYTINFNGSTTTGTWL